MQDMKLLNDFLTKLTGNYIQDGITGEYAGQFG